MTKSEATKIASEYGDQLFTRVNQYLVSQAKSGIVGGVFTYSAENPIVGDKIAAILNDPTNGWTCVHDKPTKTITIT